MLRVLLLLVPWVSSVSIWEMLLHMLDLVLYPQMLSVFLTCAVAVYRLLVLMLCMQMLWVL